VGFGPFKGFGGPRIDGLYNGFVSDIGKCSLVDSRFCVRCPFDKTSIVSMFIMKIRNVIVDDRIDKGIFNVIMGVGDPCFHFFSQLAELGVNDGVVSGFDVLAAGEKNRLPLGFSNRNLALFKAAETQLVRSWC